MKKLLPFLSVLIFLFGNYAWATDYTLGFDGTDDYIGVPYDIPYTGNKTLEAWVKLNTLTGEPGIISKRTLDTNDGEYQFFLNNGQLYLSYYGATGWQNIASGLSIPDTGWHHVAVVINSSALAADFYLDGVKASRSMPEAIIDHGSTVKIGVYLYSPATGRFLNGKMDEVRIWDYARSQSEIQADMNIELTGNESGLVMYLNLNEGSGATAADSTANGYNGNISGAVWLLQGEPATPMARWLFEGNANDSAGTYNATLVNMPGSPYVSGRCSGTYALQFDGTDDYVNTPINTTLQNFTISAWVNPETTSGDIMELVSKRSYYATATTDFPFSLVVNNAGTWAGTYVDSGNDWGADLGWIGSSFSAGQWRHIVATYDSTALKLHIDGVLANSASGSVTLSNNTGRNYTIGRAAYEQAGQAGKTNYKGLVDSVVFYSRALSTTEVGDLYNSGACNQPPVLDPIGNKTVAEGETLSFTVSATDGDNDTLTYSASNLPSGANFNPSTRTFSWTPSTGQAGTYTGVHFEVTDGTDTDSEDITITINSSGGAITAARIQSTLAATNQAIADTGMEPVRGRGLPVDFLDKAARSLTVAENKLSQGDKEGAFVRMGKAIRELKNACDETVKSGDIIRELVETPTVLECTSDGQISSDGITRAALETAYDSTAALIADPDPLWQEGALEALDRAAHYLEVAVYKMDLGKVDESFVYLGWAIGYLEEAGGLGAPTDAIVLALAQGP